MTEQVKCGLCQSEAILTNLDILTRKVTFGCQNCGAQGLHVQGVVTVTGGKQENFKLDLDYHEDTVIAWNPADLASPEEAIAKLTGLRVISPEDFIEQQIADVSSNDAPPH
jgi:hypothetical protein